MVDFKKERENKFREFYNSEEGYPALVILQKIRNDFDSAIPGYLNSLNILKDTTYEDRKHFLMELIQNADDAIYVQDIPWLKFIINDDKLILEYNESGFSREDVASITDTGSSNKFISRKMDGFIGEKGIGFKSVFALAKEVNIDSPPWHFSLSKEKCIVPKPKKRSLLKPGAGTRITISFSDTSTINTIAKELTHIFSERAETFLFLHKLSHISFEDKRDGKNKTLKIKIIPSDRLGNHITIRSSEMNKDDKYYLYSEILSFPKNLVTERWENLQFNGDTLDRKCIIAFPTPVEGHVKESEGHLFCFLPTKVTLPIPALLQIDGHTKADRERLHDTSQNEWNKHLLNFIPRFIANALLSLRSKPEYEECLIDYIPPKHCDNDQLASKFKEVRFCLHNKDWVRTNRKGTEKWVSPEESLIPNEIVQNIIETDTTFMKKAEDHLGKQFVCQEWLKDDRKSKIMGFDILEISDEEYLSLLNSVPIPQKWLNSDENLLKLYNNLSSLEGLNEKPIRLTYHYQRDLDNKKQLIAKIRSLPIFPIENRKFGRIEGEDNSRNAFFTKSKSKRFSGIDKIPGLIIIYPKYTHDPKFKKGKNVLSEEERYEDQRNAKIRHFLEKLDVTELNTNTLISDVYIPYLLGDGEEIQNKYDILYQIFRYFLQTKKKESVTYSPREQFHRLKDATFSSQSGGINALERLAMPEKISENNDNIYIDVGCEQLQLPDYFYSSITQGITYGTDTIKKRLREYLIICGIRTSPTFEETENFYENTFGFQYSDKKRYQLWIDKTKGDITENNSVNVKFLILDELTLKLLENDINIKLIARLIRNSWIEKYQSLYDGYESNRNIIGIPKTLIPGYFETCYKRKTDRRILIFEDKWAGVKRMKIPLLTTKETVGYSDNSRSIPSEKVSKLPCCCKLFDIVEEENRHPYQANAYHERFLKSLNIKSISVDDLNSLWKILPAENHIQILEAACEMSDEKYDLSGLLILDKNSQSLIPATDFCRGNEEIPGVPVIDLQYGKRGTELANRLNLSEVRDVERYDDFFSQLFSNGITDISLNDQLLNLCQNWEKYSRSEKNTIISYFKKHSELSGNKDVYVVFNDPDFYAELLKQNYSVMDLTVHENQTESDANVLSEIGFHMIDESGEIIPENSEKLSDIDLKTIFEIYKIYLDNYGDNSKKKIKQKMIEISRGDIDAIRFKRCQKCTATFCDGKLSKDIPVPFYDKKGTTLYVPGQMPAENILIQLLVIAEIGFQEDIESKVRPISEGLRKDSLQPVHSENDIQTKKSPETKGQDKITLKEVGDKIQKSSIRKKRDDSGLEESQEWKHGIYPHEINRVMESIKGEIETNLEKGPEYIQKKVRKKSNQNKTGKSNIKVVDPSKVEMHSFFKSEYGERCQVCHTLLKLKTGSNYCVTFHIDEQKDGSWWFDQPYNALCMCPNCHALAKYGSSDLTGIFEKAKQFNKQMTVTEEVEEFSGDFFVTEIEINGEKKNIVISPNHMCYFAAITDHEGD